MSNVKKLVFAALCVALGVALPIAFHSIPDGGRIFLPMHIPVLLCGLICGPWYGLAAGILAPALSCLLTSMPVPAMLPAMLCELAVYGLVAGLLMRFVKTGKLLPDVYISLIGAMLAGRLVAGAVNALFFRAGDYSLAIWLGSSFVTALPGIAIQIVLIPLLILALEKAKLIKLR